MAEADPRVGVCSVCANGRRIVSGKGSVFWLCELAASDPRFRKYPPLPVLLCAGFEHEGAPDGGEER